METSAKIFLSYSHEDKNYLKAFKAMLEPARCKGLLHLWDDTLIKPGAIWKDEIAEALASARVAVLLVSANFLNSYFIVNRELPVLLNGARAKGVTIFWVYLSACQYTQTEIADYQAAHDVSWPLDQLRKARRQAVWNEICERLIGTVQDLPAEPKLITAKPPLVPCAPAPSAHLRCALFIVEALKETQQVVWGGGPTTVLHRRLALAEGWNKKASTLLEESRSAWSPKLAHLAEQACLHTLPPLLSLCHVYTPAAGEEYGEQSRVEGSTFDNLYHQSDRLRYEMEELLKKDREFAALDEGEERWPVLGFQDKEDFGGHLYPGVQRIARSKDPMQRDFFERLLQHPNFTINQLHREGYRKALVNDTLNALLTEKWAEWVHLADQVTLQGLFEDAQGRVTPVGQRMLSRLIAHP